MFANDYTSKDWQKELRNAGLTDFNSWWNFPGEWVEEPNKRRGGWSGVVFTEITLGNGEKLGLYIKRQSNHNTRISWTHPLQGEPTFAREFRNIMYCRAHSVDTLEPVYFGTQTQNGEIRAQLVTLALSSLKPLDESPFINETALIPVIATTIRNLHATRMQHCSLYPKHIFVGQEKGQFIARLIDMEKSHKRISTKRAYMRDLDTLNRHTPQVSKSHKLRFLLSYLQLESLNSKARDIWHTLALRAVEKEQAKAEKHKKTP